MAATRRRGSSGGSLVVVGTGIRLVGQTTVEAIQEIRAAERLFHLVSEPATEHWIRSLNATARSLDDCYAEGRPRHDSYEEMTERILAAVRAGLRVCAVFYGHPGVFARPSHEAIRRARREGFSARMLPGISTEDCLFADLGVDPGECGCQSFEASDFLAYRRRFDPRSGLVLWQVGLLGEPSIRADMECRPERLRALAHRLRRHYPERHPVVLYEASQFPICDPVIRRVSLARLRRERVASMTTLYIQPLPSRSIDPRVERWFTGEPTTTSARDARKRASSRTIARSGGRSGHRRRHGPRRSA